MKLAIMGFGTIGSGVAAIVEQNAALIEHRIGAPLEVKYVLDLREFPGTSVEHKVVHDIDIIVNDPEIDVVVETMGGVEPACTFVKKALNAGKSVTTSNKVLVEKKGAELLALAEEKGVSFLFEASVGGGIPIIRPLNQCLTGDRITGVTGILNGTTNYMLTKMDREGVTFEAALKEAQQNGFAEADPTADVEGLDASRKIAILSALAYGAQVDYQDVPTEGITKITDTDFRYARALGLSVKLLGSSRCIDGKYYIQVSPVLLPPEHPLAAVNGVFNAILVQGNMVDQLMFYGRGAGSLPTASAVVADVIEELRNPHTTLVKSWDPEKLTLSDIGDLRRRFFLRLSGSKDCRAAEVEAALGAVSYTVLDGLNEFAAVTPIMTEAAFREKSAALPGVLQVIRFEAE